MKLKKGVSLALTIGATGALLMGCNFLGSPDLTEDDVVPFIQDAMGNFNDTEDVGFIVKGEENGATYEGKFDGENMYIKGSNNGSEYEMYLVDGDMYLYSDSGMGEGGQWTKFPSTDDASSELTEITEEFGNVDMTEEEIKTKYEYEGKVDCPDDIGGTCYKFETSDGTVYFDAKDKKIVKAESDAYEVTFVYDGSIKIELPEEAKNAQGIEDSFDDMLDDVEMDEFEGWDEVDPEEM